MLVRTQCRRGRGARHADALDKVLRRQRLKDRDRKDQAVLVVLLLLVQQKVLGVVKVLVVGILRPDPPWLDLVASARGASVSVRGWAQVWPMRIKFSYGAVHAVVPFKVGADDKLDAENGPDSQCTHAARVHVPCSCPVFVSRVPRRA